ncbi:MAG: 1-acyl-sn-glycerol-3-phosphate acyltransferase [Clostridiaceae bacterium]|jgi:1-acyl-sn-glycerol-3-phosphate acyltransferase|nr:1-acyl-sn-glycerol-3-phosphate acyltransferase [Clostridiaceae bacterium]
MSRENRTSTGRVNALFRRMARAVAWLYIRLFYRLSFTGLENVPAGGPAILVANHTGGGDILAIHTAIKPWIHWVAKKELFKHKLFGTVLLKLGCIPVDRKKADLTAAREIVSALRNNQIVGVFPQATRVRPDRIPYVVPHSGAIRFAIKTESPILPVGISAPFRLGGSVRIVFGKPINLRMPADSLNDADLIDGLAVDVMRKVYALVGYDYQLVDQKGGAPS